jgi:hypothetical protein
MPRNYEQEKCGVDGEPTTVMETTSSEWDNRRDVVA